MKSTAKNIYNTRFYHFGSVLKLMESKNLQNASYLAYLAWFYGIEKIETKRMKTIDYFLHDITGKYLILRNKTIIDGNIDNTTTLVVLNKVYIHGLNFSKTILLGKGKVYEI